MDRTGLVRPEAGKSKSNWVRVVLLALVVEKIVQHVFVTLAFIVDLGGLRATVAVDPIILTVVGALVAVLFGASLWGLLARREWALRLVAGLALFDIAGEFVAQGRLDIAITVSVVVATLLLGLALAHRRQWRGEARP